MFMVESENERRFEWAPQPRTKSERKFSVASSSMEFPLDEEAELSPDDSRGLFIGYWLCQPVVLGWGE